MPHQNVQEPVFYCRMRFTFEDFGHKRTYLGVQIFYFRWNLNETNLNGEKIEFVSFLNKTLKFLVLNHFFVKLDLNFAVVWNQISL